MYQSELLNSYNIPLSSYLKYYQKKYKFEINIINDDFSINDYGLSLFLNHLVERHANENAIDLIKKIKEGSYLILTLEEKKHYPELQKSLVENNHYKSAENIIRDVLYSYIIIGVHHSILENRLKKRILDEEFYLLTLNINNFSSINIPDIKSLSKKQELKELKELNYINEITSIKNPIYLGEKDEPVYLERDHLLGNLYILGAFGSSIESFVFSLLSSLILNNIRFTYIDNSNDSEMLVSVNSLFESLNKHNDIYFYHYLSLNYLMTLEINNKYSIFIENGLNKKNSEHNIFIYLEWLLKNHNPKEKYAVIFNNIGSMINNNYNYKKINLLIKELNKINVFIIFEEQGLWDISEEKEELIQDIENHIIMKTESIYSERYFKVAFNITKTLKPLEFIISKKNGLHDKNLIVYKALELSIPNKNQKINLNIP